MILNNNLQENKSLGFDDTIKFGISDVTKIFRLLSTSSYKDPIQSTIRELAANAVDAQTVIGKEDEPIYISYLSESREISILDNGCGMSPEFIKTRYKLLGETTKDSSSELIGGYGVGRFAVFSYYEKTELSKQFFLITRHEGIKYEYLVYLDSAGLPNADLISETVTEECNGSEVKFEILESDLTLFEEACEKQLKYFRTVVFSGLSVENSYKLIQGKTFIIRPESYNYHDKLGICWGNIHYPIDFNWLKISPIPIQAALYFPQSTPFEPEVARENLRQTEENRKLILSKLEEFNEEFKELNGDEYVDSLLELAKYNPKILKINNHHLRVDSFNFVKKWRKNPKVTSKNINSVFNNIVIISKEYNSCSFFNYYPSASYYYADEIYSKASITRALNRKHNSFLISFKEHNIRNLAISIGYKTLKYIGDSFYDGDVCIDEELNIIKNSFKEEFLSISNPISSIMYKDPIVRAHIKREKDEIYCKFSYSLHKTVKIADFKNIPNCKYIVYTNSREEFKILCSIEYAIKQKYGKNLAVAILHAKKYNGKIENSYTYEEFLKHPIVTSFFKNVFVKNNMPTKEVYEIRKIRGYEFTNKLTPLFTDPFLHSFFPFKEFTEVDFSQFHREKILINEFNSVKEKLSPYFNLTKEGVKYKKLYNYYKKKHEVKTNG